MKSVRGHLDVPSRHDTGGGANTRLIVDIHGIRAFLAADRRVEPCFHRARASSIDGTTTEVLEFTLSGATLSGMTMIGACHSSLAIQTTVVAPALGTFGGPTVLELTSI